MKAAVRLVAMIGIVAAWATSASAVDVKLKVEETAQTARSPGVITMGVPFARGAVKAAQWLAGKEPGAYTMADVLGLK